MSDFLKASYFNSHATIVSVGCNIGDDLISTVREWSRNVTYSVRSMAPYYKNLTIHACSPRKELHLQVQSNHIRPVRGFCIEPVKATADVLRKALRDLRWDSSITLIQAAVSSSKGSELFHGAPAGFAKQGLGSAAPAGHTGSYRVDVTTLDALAAEHAIATIDVLSVDTEGNDARVLLGALRTLPRVRYLEFEYHRVNRWARSDLQDLVDFLDQLGFDCFWAGSAGQLWRLTGCWHDSYYAQRDWSNVACASRGEAALLSAMARVAERSGASWDDPPRP